MPFVKLDCGILNSTLWFEREAREIFLTALLMAEPIETTEALPQIEIGSLEYTGWSVPPGWYGFVPAASVGIIHRAKVPEDAGFEALKMLGRPEDSSRSPDFDGRRLVRVNGGFIVLNYMKYRERDYTSAERQKRYRQRVASRRNTSTSRRNITQAEVEAEVQAEEEKTTKSAAAEVPENSRKFPEGPERGVGLVINGAQYEKLKEKYAFVGTSLRVPNALHAELMTKSGNRDAELRAWYETLDADLERTGEGTGDVFTWLRPRFQDYAVAQGWVKVLVPSKPKPAPVSVQAALDAEARRKAQR